MRIKKLFSASLIVMLVFPSTLAYAASDGKVASKEEVVYSTLSPEGTLKDIYVVNVLDVTNAGEVTDHGSYSSVKNLTDVATIKQSNNTISVEAPEGEFYYQGNMDDQQLPWTIDISYRLDGKQITAEELAGASGHLEMNIKTNNNDHVDKSFYENYLLQISLTAGSDVFKHIQAGDATVANAGGDYNISWTVMPEKKGDYTLEADVTDFEMSGLEISALPSSLPIESPDTDEITQDFESLTDAITEINNGVGELSNGIAELNNGAKDLDNGSSQFNNGLQEASNSSAELINGSKSIDQALAQISKEVANNSDSVDLSQLKELQKGLDELAKGLKEIPKQLTEFNKQYTQAYQALDSVMKKLPKANKDQQKMQQELQRMQALVASYADDDPNKQLVSKLVQTYQAALEARGTYDEVKAAFDGVSPTLTGVSDSVTKIANNVSTMSSELAKSLESMNISDSFNELAKGLSQLSSRYGEFHSGLVQYTDGVAQLASSYSELNSGIGELANGTGELASGANELHEGTTELKDSTSDLPEELQNQIDQMINQYDKSDYEPVSFVSSENENVERVQFVIRTDSIEIAEPEEKQISTVEEETENKGFWQKLMDLF